jgi:hypothetical protein
MTQKTLNPSARQADGLGSAFSLAADAPKNNAARAVTQARKPIGTQREADHARALVDEGLATVAKRGALFFLVAKSGTSEVQIAAKFAGSFARFAENGGAR